MTMREIQDLTLNTSRGLDRVDRRMTERGKNFRREFGRLQNPDVSMGIRVTAMPLVDEIRLIRVHGVEDLYPQKFEIAYQSNSTGSLRIETINANRKIMRTGKPIGGR